MCTLSAGLNLILVSDVHLLLLELKWKPGIRRLSFSIPFPDSTLNVEWFRNDKPLPFGNRWRTSYDFGFAALDIIGAYAEDSGRYTLRAKNVLGSAESHLDVKISRKLDDSLTK